MLKRLKSLVFVGLALFSGSAYGQIVDDTTRSVYGPTTTRYHFESSLKDNQLTWHFVDTTLLDVHRFNFVDRSGYLYQDLGIIGTAIRPIFFQLPETIGATTGINVFDHYFFSPSEIRYYDTKSPHIKLDIVFAGNGRSTTNVLFTRNVNPNVNIGFHYRRLGIDKQIGATAVRGDRRVLSNSYEFFGSAKSRNDRYKLLANFSRIKHFVFESGGIDTELFSQGAFPSIYSEEALPWLSNAESVELRRNSHVYQQFELKPALQIYHSFDWFLQVNDFIHLQLSQAGSYFDNFFVNNDSTEERQEMSYIQNEAGVKGELGGLFYRAYLKRKDIDFTYKYRDSLDISFPTNFAENYFGFSARYNFDSTMQVGGSGEFLDNGNFKLRGTLQTPIFTGGIESAKYEPSFIQKAYFGNHDAWNNSRGDSAFTAPSAIRIFGESSFRIGKLHLQPKLALTQLSNHIHFRDTIPVQAKDNLQMVSPSLGLRYTFLKRFHLDGEATYTLTTTKDSIDYFPVPELMLSGKLYYFKAFSEQLELAVGFDMNWKSGYVPFNYYPVLQQYYAQASITKVRLPYAFSADFFLDVRMNRGKIFFKLINLRQMATGEGFMTAPFYVGQRNVFDFGFNWIFFD